MASFNSEFTWPFTRGWMGLYIIMMEMAETRDSTFMICQLKLSAVCEGNILGWGFSRPLSNNVQLNEYKRDTYSVDHQ